MLAVISPAKSLDYETPLATETVSEARFLESSQLLIDILAKLSPAELSKLMRISDSLAELNVERNLDWQLPFDPESSRAALLAFDGDVYKGLDVVTRFSQEDFDYAQQNLAILSGLYGLLRPLDAIMAYRLEMGTKLENERGANLYDFWTREITDTLISDIKASAGADVLVNLASVEYFSAVDTDAVTEAGIEIISPRFLDAKGDNEPKVVAFHAKRARGEMAAYLIQERIETPELIQGFVATGYKFDPQRSSKDTPTFVRHND